MTWKKWMLTGVVTVVLGAIGTALWIIALQPGGGWLGRFFLTVVTLGLSSARNSVYENVARNYREAPAVMLLAIVAGIPILLPFIIFLSEAILHYFGLGASDGLTGRDSLYRRKWRTTAIVIPAAVVFAAAVWIQLLMLNYTNEAITYFHQSFAVCRPFMDAEEEKQIESQFARIKSRDDYVAVIHELGTIAAKNGAVLPRFTIW